MASVDLFTNRVSDPLIEAVPRALEDAGLCWYLNSVQHEKETGLYHYEWYTEVV